MVRVTFCLTSLITGGTELNAARTAESLDRTKFDLTVVALSDQGPLADRYRAAGIAVKVFETPSFYDPRTAKQVWRFTQFLRENRTQVLHAHSIYANIFGVPAALAAGVPCVISSRRWWKRDPNTGRALLAGNRIANRLAHRVLTNSQVMAGLIVDEEGIAPQKIAVIPNFVDEEGFHPPSADVLAKLRADIGIAPEQKVVGIVARLAPIKDHMTLLMAFGQITQAHPDWILALVGDGRERETLERFVEEQGLGSVVRFVGMMPHQPSPYHVFDLAVLSSLSEGFPNTVVEAMAARLAVVGTDVGGVPDAISHGKTGLLIPPRDIGAMADAMHRLMEDETTRREMGEAGYVDARSRFTRDRVLQQLESLYRGVLGLPDA